MALNYNCCNFSNVILFTLCSNLHNGCRGKRYFFVLHVTNWKCTVTETFCINAFRFITYKRYSVLPDFDMGRSLNISLLWLMVHLYRC